MESRRIIWTLAAGLLLAGLVFGALGGALACGFVRFDDHGYVYENPMVLGGLTPAGIRWACTTIHERWWLPLLWISYMADAEVFGLEPMGYHLTNLLLHTANVWLLAWVLFRLTGSRWRSLAVAALWAVHPLRVESVVWITERKDVLSGLFFFLALLAYVRHAERPGRGRLGLVFAALLLGLLSKASVIVLPALLLLLDYWPLRRAGIPWAPGEGKAWRRLVAEKASLFVLAGIFVVINLHTHRGGHGAGVDYSWAHRLALMPGDVWTYLRLVVWPAGLCIYYPENDAVRLLPALGALAGLAALTGALVWQGRRRPHLLVGWLWFLIALLPIVRGIRLGNAAYADRFTYLPAIGLGVLVVWGAAEFARAAERRGARRALGALAAALAIALALRARQQTQVWRNSQTLFRHAVAVTKDNAVMHYNLANVLVLEGKPAEAGIHYRETLRILPDYAPAQNNLAWVLASNPQATPAEAREALELARRLVATAGTTNAALLNTLERAQAACGEYAAAAETARAALALATGPESAALREKIQWRIRYYEEQATRP